MLNIHALPAFNDNYIWLIRTENSDKVLVVDPGDASPVQAYLAQAQLKLAAILLTHHHSDHTGGVAALTRQQLVPVWGPATEAIPGLTMPLQAGADLQLHPDFPPFTILDTPGHTAGHICYLCDDKLFCGDTLFAGGCGRLLGGTAAQLFHSLQRLAHLPPPTSVFCAHEYTEANLRFAMAVEPDNPALLRRIEATTALIRAGLPTVPSTIALELATNPFLRCNEPQIKRAAEQYAGRPLADALAVFTALRNWKDQF